MVDTKQTEEHNWKSQLGMREEDNAKKESACRSSPTPAKNMASGTGDVLTRTLPTGFFLRPGGRGTQTSALPPKAFGPESKGAGAGGR